MKKRVLDQCGVALVLALAVISLLVALTVQFMVSVNWQLKAGDQQDKGIRLNAALLGGLQLARAVLYLDLQEDSVDTLLDNWADIDGEKLAQLMDVDSLTIEVSDLSGKIQVNELVLTQKERQRREKKRKDKKEKKNQGQRADSEQIQRELWLRLLGSGRFALKDENEAVALVDALSDWLDEDDEERDHGAESSYYLGLPSGYPCRNGPLRYPEELLLIKGFDESLVYGDEEHPGLVDFITVYQEDGLININTAPTTVLMTLAPGIGEEEAELLDDFRKDQDNHEALGRPDWYKEVGGFPGDIVLNSSLLGISSSIFSVRLVAELGEQKMAGRGVLYRDAARGRVDVLLWQVQ